LAANDAIMRVITWLLAPVSGGTRLVMTMQMVSFGGKTLVDGYKSGTSGALDNLAKSPAEPASDAFRGRRQNRRESCSSR